MKFPKKYQYIILLCALAVLVFSVGRYMPRTSSRDGLIPTELLIKNMQYDLEVEYTEEGYKPDFLEVPVKAKVAFKNISSIPMWTASDPHPVHSDFSVFDAGRGYLAGETYIFEFTKTGTFGYHNHEKSLHRGIVRVIDPSNPVPAIDKTKQSQKEKRDTFLAMLDGHNPNSIFTIIDAIESDRSLANDCHDMAHDIGHRAYEVFGFSGAMTYSNPDRLSHASVDDVCAGGYIHGILEQLFLHQPELKNNLETICSGIPENNRESCFHGVGHGLMFANKRNVPISLDSCRSLGSPYYSRCFEGVWMEMFWGDISHAGSNSLGWTIEQPLVPCQQAQEDEKPACFLYAHLGYLRVHHYDFTGAVRLCTKSGLNASDERFCLKGVGITMMKRVTSQHLANSENLVAKLTSQQKYAYYEGVIGYARLSSVSESNLKKFCNQLQTDTAICLIVLKNTQ